MFMRGLTPQACAAVMNPEHFLLIALDRFGLLNFFESSDRGWEMLVFHSLSRFKTW